MNTETVKDANKQNGRKVKGLGDGSGQSMVSALKGFKRYGGKIERSVVRKPVVRRDTVLEEWAKIFASFDYERDLDHQYRMIRRLLHGNKDNISQERLSEFGILLGKFDDGSFDFLGKAGFFLNELVRLGPDTEYTIDTTHFRDGLHHIGHNNKGKHIIVEGNIGEDGGAHMKCGSVTVRGSAGQMVGLDIRGGVITIEENAGDDVGFLGMNGKIIIKGNAGTIGEEEDVNEEENNIFERWVDVIRERGMKPGDININDLPILEIHVGGDCGKVGNSNLIFYNRGELITDNRERILEEALKKLYYEWTFQFKPQLRK